MKKILKISSVLAAVLMIASCSKMAPSKSTVEAGFDKIDEALPTLTIDVSNIKYDYLSGTATVKVSISGMTSAEGFEVGLISSKEADFLNSNFVAIKEPADGTFEVAAKITGGTKYYLRASASKIGIALSDVTEINVPEFPFWANISGTYEGDVSSIAYGDKYESSIKVVLDAEDPENKCYVYGFEPYYASKGYPATQTQFNYIECSIDNENKAIIAPSGSDMHLGGRRMVSITPDGKNCHGVFTFSEDYSKMVRNWQFITVKPDGKGEDQYDVATYKRK